MTIKINGTNTTAQPSITGTDTDTGLVYGTDQVQIVTGGTTRVTVDSSGNITSPGSATFASGNVQLSSSAGVKAISSSGASSQMNGDGIYQMTTGGASAASILANGSASFAGDVYVNANLLVKGGNGSGVFIRNQGNTAYTINLNENGTATFDGNVQVGGNPISGAANGSVVLSGSGFIAANSNTAVPLWRGYTTGNGTPTSSILASGNATFAGNLGLTGKGGTDTAFYIFDTNASNATTVGINANGTATFASTIISQGDAGGGANNGSRIDGQSGFSASFNSTSSFIYRGYTTGSSSPTFSVTASGNLTVSGQVTAAGGFSDIRFKENITDANPQLADAVALGSQLKNWDWKDNAPLNEELRAKRFLGLVAQEAEKVCPGLTYTIPRTKQGKELTAAVLDEEGNETKAATYEELDDSFKAINHDILVMKLLGAVAEQNTQIEALKTQNASLEARLTALEGGAS